MRKYLHKKTLTKKEFSTLLFFIFILGFSFGMLTIAELKIDTGIVSGTSMNNTLTEGTKNLYISEDIKQIKRGDIINFYAYIDGELVNLVKRVIGLPGETVYISIDSVYINGELIEEPYSLYTHSIEDDIEVKIKEDEYFVLGDNRCDSYDSRHYGAIPKHNILGVIIY